ncbi:uncharacterized protein LOC129794631 [Lutzomyia longipalpis]|nr:uncharacterized protein LOC129794631 [Lutzomyia longipalpis]
MQSSVTVGEPPKKGSNNDRVKYGENPDVKFFFPNNGGALLLAEKVKFARISEIFRKQLPTSNAENGERVVITDISFEIFNNVVKFIYGEELTIYEENYLEILYIGKKYFLYEIIHKVIKFIYTFINADNMADHFEFIDKFDISSLNDFMKGICISSPLVVIRKLTKSIPHKRILQIILESPCLPCSEYELYQAIVDTYFRNVDKEVFDISKYIRDELGKLIFLIRFPTMTNKEIINCTKYPSLLTKEQSMDFLLWIEDKIFTDSLQYFSSVPRLKCNCQVNKPIPK